MEWLCPRALASEELLVGSVHRRRTDLEPVGTLQTFTSRGTTYALLIVHVTSARECSLSRGQRPTLGKCCLSVPCSKVLPALSSALAQGHPLIPCCGRGHWLQVAPSSGDFRPLVHTTASWFSKGIRSLLYADGQEEGQNKGRWLGQAPDTQTAACPPQLSPGPPEEPLEEDIPHTHKGPPSPFQDHSLSHTFTENFSKGEPRNLSLETRCLLPAPLPSLHTHRGAQYTPRLCCLFPGELNKCVKASGPGINYTHCLKGRDRLSPGQPSPRTCTPSSGPGASLRCCPGGDGELLV